MNDIHVEDDFPPIALEKPFTAEQQQKLGQLHWKWTLAYNRAKSAPRTPYTELNKEQCEQMLKLLDMLLKAPIIGDPK
jgi:hypothetical protein